MRCRWAKALVLVAIGSGCKKDDVAPLGTINGRIDPAAAVTAISATDQHGVVHVAAFDTTTGKFLFPNLTTSTYVVAFRARAGFEQPAARVVTVESSDTVRLGTLAIWRAPLGSYTVNGSPIDPLVPLGSLVFGEVGVRFETTTWHYLQLQIGPVSGPGTFPIGATSSASAYYTDYAGGLYTWATRGNPNCSGEIVVSRYNATARRISGTFQISISGSSGGLHLTNGTFTDVIF